MGKMIQVSQEAYNRLAAAKRKGESFSDVVLRILNPPTKRLPLQGLQNLMTPAERARADQWLREADELDRADARRQR